ncbi:MAG: hypothetical protein GX236_05325, partial [Clostridiaceae bacterium]|nr:hypothetical protein [Clostridiaceae bacterium]
MKGKCRFILSLILLICSASGIIAFADDSDALTGTYDSEISIMTIQSPEDGSQDVVAQDGETAGVAPQFKVNAKAAILIEAETGKVLFSYNE